MLEYILLAEMSIVTGIVTLGAISGLVAISKIKGTVEPIVGLINMFGSRR